MIGCVHVARDITEHKCTEDALRQAEEKYRSLFENATEGIFQTTPEGTILSANAALARIHGYDSPEELMHTIKDVATQLHVDPHFRSELIRLLNENNVVQQFEAQVYRKDGSKIWISVNARTIRDADGRVVRYEGTNNDITQRKEAEEKVRLYEEKLHSLIYKLSLAGEKERRRIAVDLHDCVGQTLAFAKIKLESLQEMASSTGLTVSIDKILKLIEQALQFTRTLTLNLSPPVLYELGFEAAVEWLAEQVREQHGLVVDFEDDGEPKPMGEPTRILLFTTVRELVANIVKHAKAQRANLSIRRDGARIHITVEDDGCGFNVSEKRHLGNDFGLFSVRERLQHIGGNFEIESHPGRGTRLTLVAPLEC
jgi:PAS domain S-box-containing protein